MREARRSFRTLWATIRTRTDEARYIEAFERHSATLGPNTAQALMWTAPRLDAERAPKISEHLERRWIERPSCVRSEQEGGSIVVTDGRTSWLYQPSQGTIVAEGPSGPMVADYHRHDSMLNPARVERGLDLEPVERLEWKGREAIRVRAIPRNVYWDDTEGGLSPGADEYELFVDAERGILLRAAAFLEGEEFATTELLEVAFDESFSPETFTFVPPAGEPVRTPADLERLAPRPVTIDEAASLAPFPVWIPARRSEDASIHATFWPAEEEDKTGPRVTIWCPSFGPAPSFSIDETGARDEGEPSSAWERIQRAGQQLLVWPGGAGGQPTHVRLERGGTIIDLSSSDDDLEALLELAVSLVRVPAPDS